MSDIVERLRYWGKSFSLGMEAADEIEKLRAERRAMQGALLAIKAHTQHAHPMSYINQLCRIARSALGEKE
jgi:hypothetical protein